MTRANISLVALRVELAHEVGVVRSDVGVKAALATLAEFRVRTERILER